MGSTSSCRRAPTRLARPTSDMLVLDTSVLAELMRPVPAQGVVDWLDGQEADSLFITAITVAELRYGIARLPEGKRKAGLLELGTAIIREEFAGRILPFDEAAAICYADVVCERQSAGSPISMADAQIAAICRALPGFTLATRNVKDFQGIRLDLVDPWVDR